MARLGIGILIIPQKPWETVMTELGNYRSVFSVRSTAPTRRRPSWAGWTYCDENAVARRRWREIISVDTGLPVAKHYESWGTSD